MSILVVCPGCRKSFQVNEKFAGKSGPCPKCKTTIRVPTEAEEVKIHTPEAFSSGGRSVSGELVLKPIARKQVKIEPILAAVLAAASLCVLLIAWMAGGLVQGSYVVRALGLFIVSPPLVFAGYTFLRDDELEPYRGLALYARLAACAAAYMFLWAVFGHMKAVMEPLELWQWMFLAPPFLLLGSLTAWVSFDLEPGTGFFHYAFYLLMTVLLGWVSGLGWVWQ